ncbi:hypothetical protein DNTS_015963 [Danionella cerebrum]|uniref:Transmembrane protein 254 n=1 Tax=Danionella cerebrum TaxID=2873325 RepID=A0A553RHG7_9TELE|nr:hypothetical protein DNTS_015963 [Danionella translucida]
MARSDGSSFFRRSNSFWIVTISLSLAFYTCSVFWPELIPFSSLGPFGALVKHLVDNHYPVLYYGWYLTWIIHLLEALFAMKLCSDKGIHSSSTRLLWFVQTFLFGFASLGLLVKYSPDGRSKRH